MAALTEQQRELVLAYTRFAYTLARKTYLAYRSRQVSQEDLTAAAMVGLCEAAVSYREGVAGFAAWSRWSIRRQMQLEIQRAGVISVPTSQVRNPQSWQAWETVPLLADQASSSDAAEQEQTGTVQESVRKVLDRLPDRYRSVLIYSFVHGLTLDEVSRHMDISRSRAGQLRREAEKLFRILYASREGVSVVQRPKNRLFRWKVGQTFVEFEVPAPATFAEIAAPLAFQCGASPSEPAELLSSALVAHPTKGMVAAWAVVLRPDPDRFRPDRLEKYLSKQTGTVWRDSLQRVAVTVARPQ